MDWTFDIRSALLVGALLTVLVGGLLLLASRSFPPAYRESMNWWATSTFLLPCSFVMLVLRDAVPPWVAVTLSNTLIAAGLACVAIAIEVFQSRPRRRLHLWALVAAIAVCTAGLGHVLEPAAARLSVVAGLLAALLACGFWNLYRRPTPDSRSHHILGVVLALSVVILGYRALAMFFDPGQVTDVFALSPVQVLTYAVGSVLPVVASFGFLLMCTERSQRELRHAAGTDYLTGCFNRRAIEQHGARAIAAARRHGMPLAILVVDIDHFKRINDELGHAAGDLALVQAVTRIRTTLRTEDLLGRLGGEEFIVLMPNTDSASAVSAGERIREGFSALPLRMGGDERTVTLSIGVAVLAPADRQFSQLLQRADRAMYAAKNAGRDLVMADAMSGWENPQRG
jgi:diguanylate cyclase (GGDEF)-like protein